MLMPKRTKYRKQFRGRLKGKATRGNSVAFGEFGLQSLEPAWITSRQIEAARRAMVRHMKRRGKLWIRIFPDKSVTKRAAETRMGKGKGSVDHWVAVVKPGRVIDDFVSLISNDNMYFSYTRRFDFIDNTLKDCIIADPEQWFELSHAF